jgi:hypothetical protein
MFSRDKRSRGVEIDWNSHLNLRVRLFRREAHVSKAALDADSNLKDCSSTVGFDFLTKCHWPLERLVAE